MPSVKVDLPSVAGRSFGDAFIIGLFKQVEERSLAPLIGNGTFKSGALKLVIGNGGAYALKKLGLKGKMLNLGQDAFNIDAVEDLVNASVQALGGGILPQQSNRKLF